MDHMRFLLFMHGATTSTSMIVTVFMCALHSFSNSVDGTCIPVVVDSFVARLLLFVCLFGNLLE